MIGIDSSVLIDVLRNKSSIDKLKSYYNELLCTSEIVVYEICYGFYASSQDTYERLMELESVLDVFVHIFPVDRKASVKSAQIGGRLARAGKMIEHRDVLIAGCLLANGCDKILTKNAKDFKRISGLKVIEF